MNKEVRIGSILTEYNFDRKSFDEAKLELLKLCDGPSEFQDRKLKDILNWVKSDLAQEATPKLARTQTPYRIEKLRFLRKLEILLTEEDASKKADYDKFYNHLKEYEILGMPTGLRDLVRLAKRYNCEIPKVVDGKFVFKTI